MPSFDNDDFDSDAYLKASKALHIIFILLILMVNGLLIVKNVRKLDFIYKPKTLTILSLAIGDVLLALFPMVVQTKNLFGDYTSSGMSCSLIKSFTIYTPYLITFVYSIGLMVLGFEIIQSHKNSMANKDTQIIYSLAYSSLPWILGLIIILPLGLANIDENTCVSSQTMGQARALFIIGIILPACGAVITSIFVKHRASQTRTTQAQGLVVLTSQTTSSPEGVVAVSHGQPQVYNKPSQQQPHVFNQPPQQPGQIQIADPTYNPGNIPMSTDQTGVVITPATVNWLLGISVVNFFLVIPIAIFFLSYTLNENHDVLTRITAIAINDFVFWLNILRSVITPLMMYLYSDN